jgi:hypothetical protein
MMLLLVRLHGILVLVLVLLLLLLLGHVLLLLLIQFLLLWSVPTGVALLIIIVHHAGLYGG